MSRVSAKNKKFYEEVLESYCDVCFTQFRKVPAKKINEGLEILVCTKCHCKVHKCCYDLEAQQTVINDKVRQFVCQKCTEPKPINNQCFVCHHTDGALILTQDQDWVHVFCALYHNQIDILSYTPRVRAQKSISYEATSKLCDHCKLPNAFESCAYQNCHKIAHPYCAKKIYAEEELKNDEPKCWNHHLTCGPSNLFDLKNEPIPFALLKETIDQKFSQVEESAPFQIPNKQVIMKKIYDGYIKEIKQQKKDSKTVRRGGFSFISCPQHEFTPHCICQGTGQGGDMIECQTCLTWYHMDCIKYKKSAQEQYFSCMFCKNFYELKKKIIDEVIGGKNDNFEIKSELPAKMSFMDVMWIVRGIDSRIAKGNTKILKELGKYPLRTSKMDKIIKIQNKKTLEILCEDFFHEYFFSDQQIKNFKPYPVLGLDSTNKPIKIEENIQKNKKLRQFIITLQKFCNQMEIVHEFKAIETELDFKEQAVSDSYEKIIELSKSQQKYQEVAILKIKAQAYSFLQIVKKVNSGTIITINQLQQSVRKASLIENVPEYLTQPLTQKYQKVKSIIKQLQILIQSDPYNLLEIKQTANKLTTDFKIEPPIFYDLYLEERNFTNTLYFYHVKQTEGKIQGQLSLKEKLIELVTSTSAQSFPCNEELTRNLNSFLELRQKANYPKYAFEQLKSIIINLQKKTVKQTLINLQPNTIFKKQKLEYLFGKFLQYNIQDPQISSLIQKYQEISKNITELLEKSLENITSLNTLRMMNDSCSQLMTQLEKFPLKVQQQTKHNKSLSWLHIVRNKKQEINQLLTLAQEAQLEKNPLSISKLTETIPKDNPLVKAYKELKKQHHDINSQFVNLLALCSQKIQYLKSDGAKKTRKQQIEINDKKPDLKRFNEVLEMLNHSKVDFSKEIKELTKIINKSLDISYSVQKFAKAKQTFESVNSTDELANARKQIDELRKKVLINSEIALTKQLTQLYHCEIHNRIRSNYLSGNFDLDKNNKLLKFAEEEGINKTPTYFKLKEKFDSKNQKSKQINLIKNIEIKLKEQASKETDPVYKNLYALRKQLKVPDVDQQTPKITYIEELKEKNKQIKARIAKIQSSASNPETKITLDQAKSVLLEALKSPFNFTNLHQFYLDVQRCHSFYTNWKRSHNLGRNTLYNDDKLREYQKLKFKVEELQIASKEIYKLKSSLKILQTIENIQDESLQVSLNQNLYENLSLIEQNLEAIEENILAGQDTEMIMTGKKKYLKIWTYYLKNLKRQYSNIQKNTQNTNENSVVLVNAKKIKKLLYDSYYLLQNQLKSTISVLTSEENINELKQCIIFLQQLFLQIKFNYLEGHYDKRTNIMDSWIDLDDFVYEIKVGGSLDELFFVYKPFDDLNKFKYRNLSGRNSDLLLTSKPSTREETGKRVRPDDMQVKQERPLMKKVSSQSQYVAKEQSSDSEQKQNQNIVTANSRKKVKEILSKNILKNLELKKVGTCENQVKMIQNQIFGEYHDDVVKYFETSEKFEKLFIKLQSCPQISKKMVKKEFEFKFIKLLVENLNTISDIETMMVNKLIEEKNAQKYSSLQAGNLEISAGSKIEEENNNVLEMLATGKVNEEYKKDLADEMKKIKEGKDKKKKKSKHKNRSRSRSASPAAKFSSEQEEENLPSYIQKQYAQDTSKKPLDVKLPVESLPVFARVEQPLMFDPQINEVEMEDIEKKYPRGSTLKIKSANLQFFLKKKGKMEMKVNIYCSEDYKKIVSDLVDPGFTALNIRKEKNDKQILDYLNKPSKKKYRFLVGWIEAETPQLNENLKELSEQANERHKIYGWQNELIKVHVMSIKQFVQLTRFSSTTPKKTIFKECVQMFDSERIICVFQYPAQKMFQLKEKFKNFSEIQRIDQVYDVSVPLPTYDTYEPIETLNPPYYPAMEDVQAPNIPSIKQMGSDDFSVKESKPVEFQGWGSSSVDTSTPVFGRTNSNPYEQTRARLGFGRFSPINTDEEDNIPSSRESLPDVTDSILKSLEKKDSFSSIPPVVDPISYKPQRQFPLEPYEQQQPMPYGQKFNRPYHHNQPKFYNEMGGNNPMHQVGMNPMRGGYNNPMGGGFNQHHNRGYNSHQGQNFGQNRYQNHGNDFRPNFNNQFNQNRNMPYQRHNRNPMFNPMNNPMNPMQNNPMQSNPMHNNPMQNNPMYNNPIQSNPMQNTPGNNNAGNFGQGNQYPNSQHQNNPRYPGYQQHGNNHGGYPQ